MTATKPVAPASVAPLAADLDAALRRLKLATVRRNAAEVLQVAKTQRWTPEEILRTLVEAEIAARDASNTANRLKAAAFPVVKTLDGFDVSGSSVTQATFDYLSSLEWVRAQQNLAAIGPPGTGKSHLLIGCGYAAVHAGFKVRYFTAADLIEVLYRGLADNTVGKIIDTLLRADLVILDEIGFAPLDDTGTQLCSGSWPPATNVAHWLSPHTGPLSNGDASCPNTPPPPASSTACCTTPPSSSPPASPTECATPTTRREPPRRISHIPATEWGLLLATSGDFYLAIDTAARMRAASVNGRSSAK